MNPDSTFRWAIVSNTTVAPLVQRLKAALPGHEVFLSEHGEMTQQVLSPLSSLYAFKPDLVVLYLEIKSSMALTFPFMTLDDRKANCDEIIAHALMLVKTLRSRCRTTLLVNNFAVPPRTALGVGLDPVFKTALRNLNLQLEAELRNVSQCYVFDCDSLWAEAGWSDRDQRFEMLAQFPFGPKMQQLLVAEWLRYYRALQGMSRKCVVVDLDNTLWGGILGEDGPDKIEMGDTPEGRPYRRLQESLLALRRRGVLLAINSKNNADEALAVLRSHPDMVLREEDFAATQINWEDKAANLTRIVTELNIGTQSVVFLDDNPAERDWVHKAHPQVLVPEFPKDKSQYADLLTQCELDTIVLTDEDLKRTQLYREDRQRREILSQVTSFDDFLQQLQIKVQIETFQARWLDRMVQLCQRTNQFNLTTRRHNAEQIQKFAASPDAQVFFMSVCDRFGDYGWTGLAIAQANGPRAVIETFLLSCRVLGKNVEFALFDTIAQWSRVNGCTELQGEFIPTAKNAPCADFYTKCGLQSTDGKTFHSTLADLPAQPIHHITLRHE